MTRSVRDSDFVPIVCTPRYAAKAIANEGGVGFEGSVIAGSILTSGATQNKFIPLLRAGTPAESIPLFRLNRLYIDFKEEFAFAAEAEHLARHMCNRPSEVPPPIGDAGALAQPDDALRGEQPRRWIVVAGTGNRDRLPKGVEKLCVDVGHLLATSGFGLVTGGWPGVDRAVSQAFAASVQSARLPLDNFLTQVVERSWTPPFKRGRIIPVPSGEAEYIEAVKRADAAVLIGGLGGTYRTGEYMRAAGKPVFPISQTGGDAARFFARMSGKWYDGWIPSISKQQYFALEKPPVSTPKFVLHLLEHWAEQLAPTTDNLSGTAPKL